MTARHTAMPLETALHDILRQPLTLVREWNWKAAAFSAILRGVMFFLLNRHAGYSHAAKAMAVELIYAMAAAGIAGAVTQRLRHAVPLRKTAAFVFLVIPLVLLIIQAAVHVISGTPRVGRGLLLSYLFASMATGFSWFAMGRGIFLTDGKRSFWQDLLQIPDLVLQIIQSCRHLLLQIATGSRISFSRLPSSE